MKLIILLPIVLYSSCLSLFQSEKHRNEMLVIQQNLEIEQTKQEEKQRQKEKVLDYMRKYYSNMHCGYLPVEYGILLAEDTCRMKYRMLVDNVGDFEVICFKDCVNL